MNRTLFLLGAAVLGIASCSNEGPDAPRLLTGPPLTAKGGGAQSQQYTLTFLGGLGNDPAHALSGMGRTGDPFAKFAADPAYLALPSASGGATAVCDQDGSGQPPTSGTWGAYGDVWKGSLSVTAKSGGGYTHHVGFSATREDGTGFLALVVNGTPVKSADNLTLTFTNVRGLVSAGSTPDGGPVDPQDRCLTFSITATP